MPSCITDLIVELEREPVLEAVRVRIEAGEDPLVLLEECRQGMLEVGKRFQEGDYYLAELMISGELFKEAMEILDPHLAKVRSGESVGTVVLATMHGDIHDLGKNIVATLLRVHNFEVHDLGVNVAPEAVVEKVKEVSPDIVGFSSLITTSFESTRTAAELLVKEGLRDKLKIVVGGGVTTPEFGEYVGADFQTLDASVGVAYCLEAVGEA
ncbi:MAG: cobalamin-dependent protein [Deltaproteobacteria bacterium]|nr:cobalamin-dependent protein [Deltaproteobacteria bacterium]